MPNLAVMSLNKRQKIVQQQFLDNEEAVINRLKQVYGQSLKDINIKSQELQNQIIGLQAALDTVEDADEKARLKSMIQSKVYQKQYQDALKKQVASILDNLHVEEFKTISEYLQKCYEDGFVGTMYDLQGQGIPLAMPLDQEAVVRAVQLDSPIKEGLYAHLGEDVKQLKKYITAEVSRGISTGMSWELIALQLSGKMMGTYQNPGGSLAYAMRIARTEGHRIQVQGAMDACYKAKDVGADVVKQWDSTLDGRTRPSHQKVDGEIRELDEPFSNGLMFPGDPDGGAAEVVNCRCALFQRARWDLDTDITKMDNETGELVTIKAKDYDSFKKQYFEEAEKIQKSRITLTADKEQFERYRSVLGKNAPKTLEEFRNIKYNDGNKWDELKYQYRTVNRYEVDGKVTADKILQLDNVAFYEKKKGFDYSSLTGSRKDKARKAISNGGNAASMEFDGKVYFSHSKFGLPGSFELSLYKNEYPAVALSNTRMFKEQDLGDGVPRQFDTEAKFLEFVATQKKPDDKFTVTILSEKHICKSCQGIVEQFKQTFPNSTINIVSGKLGYNGDENGLHTWKHRKKVK